MRHHRRHDRRARAALGWGLAGYALIQLLVVAFLDLRHPEIYDPECDARLTALRARLRERPGRPLLLVVGSSRTVCNFCPERLPELRTPAGDAALVFNYAHTGGSPLINLMEIRRLVRQGVRPTWLAVEIMPPFLADWGPAKPTSLAGPDDLAVLCRFIPRWKIAELCFKTRVSAWYEHRADVLVRWASGWVSAEVASALRTAPLGGPFGAGPLGGGADPAEARRRTDFARIQYLSTLQRFHIAATADRPTRHLVEWCRREGIPLLFYLAPEGSEFRSWYSADARAQINDYCARLRREYGVTVIDARTWLPDEYFIDSHHTVPRGAVAFTERFGAEVLGPLVRGQGIPADDAAGRSSAH